MNKKLILVMLLILIVCGSSAFIGWCAGYNFDERSPQVAVWIGVTLASCFPIAGIAGLIE